MPVTQAAAVVAQEEDNKMASFFHKTNRVFPPRLYLFLGSFILQHLKIIL